MDFRIGEMGGRRDWTWRAKGTLHGDYFGVISSKRARVGQRKINVSQMKRGHPTYRVVKPWCILELP